MTTILNIGCHPKDCLIYSAGTVAKHTARGDKVCNLAVTHGVRWTHWRAVDELSATGEPPDIDALIEEKKREFIEASKEIGVTDVRFLGVDDEVVLVDREVIDDIADVIVDFAPDVIITHWPYDSVSAHANTTQMVLHALDAVSAIRAKNPRPAHHVKQIFYHTSLGSMNVQENHFPRTPNTLIDVTEVAHLKERAMNKLHSQYYSEDHPEYWWKTAEIADGVAGGFARVPFAEAFVAQYPQLSEYVPVAESSLYSSGKDYASMFADIYRFPLHK